MSSLFIQNKSQRSHMDLKTFYLGSWDLFDFSPICTHLVGLSFISPLRLLKQPPQKKVKIKKNKEKTKTSLSSQVPQGFCTCFSFCHIIPFRKPGFTPSLSADPATIVAKSKRHFPKHTHMCTHLHTPTHTLSSANLLPTFS